MIFIAVAIIAYLIGAIPFALILVKSITGANVINEGTGNVGAMNSYDITGKKWIGITVFFLDMLKGAVAILMGYIIGSGSYSFIAIAGLFVILGHNYNIFLGLKGGRGLASGAGIFLMINPLPIIHWCMMWLAGYYIIKRNVHIANGIAIAGMPILIFSTPVEMINFFNVINIENVDYFKIHCLILAIVVLLSHIKPIKELLLRRD
jgi:glycerol-3-phosphate acyltransferase PlsY